jgi:hypothetical protein
VREKERERVRERQCVQESDSSNNHMKDSVQEE